MLCTLIGAIILSINIQVGLNMHLYDDIGDASSSLRGSTSSSSCANCEIKYYFPCMIDFFRYWNSYCCCCLISLFYAKMLFAKS